MRLQQSSAIGGLVSRVGTQIIDTTIQTYTHRPIFQKGLASARGHTATGGWSRAGILLGGKQDQVLASSRLASGLETKQEPRTQGSRGPVGLTSFLGSTVGQTWLPALGEQWGD